MILDGIRSLWDVPGLERIRKVCSLQGVHFTAFGDLLRNLSRKTLRRAETGEEYDLFDLAPFASDIDLIHTGKPEQTALLLRSLVYEIPWGEYFRWQLRAIGDNQIFWESMKVNNVIPASLMTLSTNSTDGVFDRWDGIRDLSSRKFRFLRNAYYTESPLFRAGRDLEVFSALLYYRVLFESGLDAEAIRDQPGLADARRVVQEACDSEDTFIHLEESAYLRARLRYLCAALSAAARPGHLQEASELLGLQDLIDYTTGVVSLGGILFPPRTLTIAAHLAGDRFRVPFDTENWVAGEEAVVAFNELLADMTPPPQEGKGGDTRPTPTLGPGQEILLASPPVTILEGISSSSHAGEDWMHEFVHFVPLVADARLFDLAEKQALTALMGLHVQPEEGARSAMILSPPVVVEHGEPGLNFQRRLFVRINCGGLAERLPALERERGGAIEVRFFVVGWTGF
jgi:hypothetical protein